jgi:hypothetical protein
VPIYDMMVRGKAGTDKRFYGWYAGDYAVTNPPAPSPDGEEPARAFLVPSDANYIEQQRQRLPNHIAGCT